MICKCCGQEKKPTLSMEEYEARAIPRLEAIDRLAEKINFSDWSWKYTMEGERYEQLMKAQAVDEEAAGL